MKGGSQIQKAKDDIDDETINNDVMQIKRKLNNGPERVKVNLK